MVLIDPDLVSAVTTAIEISETLVTLGITAVITLQEVVMAGITILEAALSEVVTMAGVIFLATLITHGGE